MDLQSSGVGRQMSSSLHETDEIIRAVVGVKSPMQHHMKRTNALLSYYRWHSINMEGNCYPLQEGQLWQYLRSMADDGSAATKSWCRLFASHGLFFSWMGRISVSLVGEFWAKQKFSLLGKGRQDKLVHLQSRKF